MLEKLFKQLYKKLENEKENDKKSKNGCFDYFVNIILKNDAHKVGHFSITSKAIKNYYEKYVEKKANKSGEPRNELKNLIAAYLGLKDYIHFVKINSEKEEEEEKIIPKIFAKNLKKKNFKIQTTAIIIIIIIGLFGVNYYFTDTTCIVWKKNHFKPASCSNKNAINNVVYTINIDNFKQIEVTKETTFFKNGKPIVWYGKAVSGKVEFFSFRGIHPATLKELSPITEYIINKYVLTNNIDKTITN